MRRTYYQVLANDGSPVSKELSSLKAARKELKDIIKEDMDEFGLEEGLIDYYIEKCTEVEGTIYSEEIRR